MKHIWIKSLNIDDKGGFSKEALIILSPSLETKRLKLKPTNDQTINDAFIKVSFKDRQARIKFYKHPIQIGNQEYIMYKRSASSSRQGNVLFIRSDLFGKMDQWSNCGIDLSNPENRDGVSTNFLSFQAYRALTLSGCENFIHLNPKNILVIEDLYSTFSKLVLTVSNKAPTEKVYNLENIGKKVYAYENNQDGIKNSIWDGQGFLDDSVFSCPEIEDKGAQNKYSDHSMMILRNRFFKSCVFRTRLQKWFRDLGLNGKIEKDAHGKPIKINGYTEANRYEDIKMVVTHSSLKYIKFFHDPMTAIKQWMNTVDDVFGIVKTDTPTTYFGGKYVRTNYQLLNTICMTEEETVEFLKQNKNIINKIGSSSKAFIAYVESCSGRTNDTTKEKEIDADKFFESPYQENDDYFNPRFEVCRKLVGLNRKFDRTYFYKVFIRNYVKQLSKNIEIGKVLIEGTYATIVSNPYEMLNYIVKQYNIEPGQEGHPLMLREREIYSTFFDDGVDILGSRSPHILPGNILLSTNLRSDEIDRYFVFNPQIVCINSIGSLILHRLNGSDQDGDAIFLTNNELLVKKARTFDHYPFQKFTVPVNGIAEAAKTHYIEKGTIDVARFAKADHRLSNNLIGAIVNLSQKYNSILWDTFIREHRGDSNQMEKLHRLYFLNSILEVLSNNEIDAAKGKTDFQSKSVLKKLKEIANRYHKKDPLFFVGIEEKKTQKEVDKEVENKGKLALGDETTKQSLWFKRTTSDIGAIAYDEGLWTYKPAKKDFKKNEDTKDLDVNNEITLLFVAKKHPNSLSCRSVLIKNEAVLENFRDQIHKFKNVKEALEYENYSEKELYLIKAKIRTVAHFNHEKYETTMDYVYENAASKILGGTGNIAHIKLSDCYKPEEGVAPNNNCEEDTKRLINRLEQAEKVRQIILKNTLGDDDLEVLEKVNLKESHTLADYKEYLFEQAKFQGVSFFSSKDRIKSLIRKLDEKKEDHIRLPFYLALYLMFNDPKSKYKEIFEVDENRQSITAGDIADLLSEG